MLPRGIGGKARPPQAIAVGVGVGDFESTRWGVWVGHLDRDTGRIPNLGEMHDGECRDYGERVLERPAPVFRAHADGFTVERGLASESHATKARVSGSKMWRSMSTSVPSRTV